MEGHIHEHGFLYTCVPFFMFDEGEWVVVCIVVVGGGWWWWWWSEGSGRAHVPVLVVSLSSRSSLLSFFFSPLSLSLPSICLLFSSCI